MATGEISWIELPGGDCTATGRFYSRVFGWDVEEEEGFGIRVRDTSGHQAGMFRGDLEPASGGPLLYIGVDDMDETLAAVEAEGGTAVSPRTLIDESIGWWASFRDPAGNLLGIWQAAQGG
jgi:predicted enzyme related to lactoylglutathione lyase